MKVRASKVPLGFACPGALGGDPDKSIGGFKVAADLGTALHAAISEHVSGLPPDLSALSARYGCDLGELKLLHYRAAEMWGEVSAAFPTPEVEVYFESGSTTGTADLVHHDGEHASVGDWKSGRIQGDTYSQLLTYATMLVRTRGMPVSGEVWLYALYVRLGEYEAIPVTERDIDMHEERIADTIEKAGREFNPGHHCGLCSRRAACDVRSDWLASTARSLTLSPGAAMSVSDLARAYPKVQQIEQAIKDYRDTLRSMLEADGGEFEVDDSTTLSLTELSRDTVDSRAAFKLLRKLGYSDEDIASCTRLSKPGMMALASRDVPRGDKAKAKAHLLDALDQAGAISRMKYRKLELKRKVATNESETSETERQPARITENANSQGSN